METTVAEELAGNAQKAFHAQVASCVRASQTATKRHVETTDVVGRAEPVKTIQSALMEASAKYLPAHRTAKGSPVETMDVVAHAENVKEKPFVSLVSAKLSA